MLLNGKSYLMPPLCMYVLDQCIEMACFKCEKHLQNACRNFILILMHSHHVCIDYAQCRLDNNLSQNRQGLYFECLIWPLVLIVSVPGLYVLLFVICIL